MRTWLIALMLLLVPSVAAHGAPEPREIDTRLLVDSENSGDYGASGTLDGGGIDLLALDVYEGTLPGSASPALVFRVMYRGGAEGDHRIEITAGSDITLELTTSDVTSFASTTFAAVRGPFPVGDGHQHVVEGVVALATLGIAPGDAITDIRVQSQYDGDPQDDMPGSWYYMGQAIPQIPPADDPAGQYTVKGPAPIFTVEADKTLLPAGSTTKVTLNLSSALDTLDQTVSLSAQAPTGINVALGDSILSLTAGADATTTFEVSGTALGTVRVLMESDLGVAQVLTLPLDGAGRIGTGSDVDSGDIESGQSFQYTFTTPATFEYHCHPHPWMVAKITIVEAENGTAPETHVVRIVEPSDAADWAFDPKELTIRAGDSVLWSNEGETLHTVMGSTGIGHGHDGHDHDHDHDHAPPGGDKDSPAAIVLLPLAIALWAARRRG